MFVFQLYEEGALYGMRYRFPKAGDGIPMHDHIPAQEHNVMVLRGSLKISGEGWSIPLSAGQIFTPVRGDHYPHEIVALEPETVMVGMFLHGKPEGECVPQDERSGVIDRPVTRRHDA